MNKEYLIYKLSDEVKNSCKIDKDAFKKFNVKRGLRNEDGSGVLVGLTNIGNVVGYERDAEGKLTPTEGKLYYRGYELDDLVTPLLKEKRFGFEEVAFLLLSGQLPDKEELDAFKELLNDNMPLDHLYDHPYHRAGRQQHHEHPGPLCARNVHLRSESG